MKSNNNINGFVNLLKPVGPTASDMVVKIRRLIGAKVGHLGTLDPGACGVLPIALGKGTKLFDLLTFKQKSYRASFTFGKATDTLDSYGVVTATSDVIPTSAAIRSVLGQFVGEIDQLPPQYSALSVDGVRAYKLAREGIEIELKPRKIEIFGIDLIGQTQANTFTFDIICGGGTYIRSIVRDMATALGTVGYMSSLIRTSSGVFTLDKALTIDEFEINPFDNILSLDYPVMYLPKMEFEMQYYKQLCNGVRIPCRQMGYYRVYCNGEFFGVAKNLNNMLELEYNLHI